MLPFLKNKQEASMSQDEDQIDNEDFGTIDAVAQDLLDGLQRKDKVLIKSALSALCDYIKAEDIEQDQSLIGKE